MSDAGWLLTGECREASMEEEQSLWQLNKKVLWRWPQGTFGPRGSSWAGRATSSTAAAWNGPEAVPGTALAGNAAAIAIQACEKRPSGLPYPETAAVPKASVLLLAPNPMPSSASDTASSQAA